MCFDAFFWWKYGGVVLVLLCEDISGVVGKGHGGGVVFWSLSEDGRDRTRYLAVWRM